MKCFIFQNHIAIMKKNFFFELDLSNYVIKYNLKRATAIDTSKFAKKVDLTSLK